MILTDLVVEYRLAMFAGTVYSGCEMSTWCFSSTGELHYSVCPYEKEALMFFHIGGCMEYALSLGSNCDRPFIMSDSLGLVWAGQYAKCSDGDSRLLIIMGPVFYSESSARNLENGVRDMNFSILLRRTCLQVLKRVPVLPMNVMKQYIQMMNYTITQESILSKGVYYQHTLNQEDDPAEELGSVIADHNNEYVYERAYSTEQTIMQCIKNGSRDYETIIDKVTNNVQPDNFDTGIPVREAKNSMLIFTALCARAAIDGGMPISSAKQTELYYIRSIEKSDDLTALLELKGRMLDAFMAGVYDCKNNPDVSKPIRECCDYVKAHFMEPLDLQGIAKAVGYTEYYLTRKFQKEMGIRLLDYIKLTRIEYAKIWLITTDKTIQEISEQLHFGTRNYFSRIFKEKEGMTPAEYRDKIHGKAEEVKANET